MVLIGKALPGPSTYTAADKNKAREADSRTGDQAREAKRDPEGEEERPRCASRHLDGLSLALFRIPNIHHNSPPDEVHDCEHHDPHAVYEVPIKSNDAEAFALPRVNPTEQGEDECCAEKKQPDDNMSRVESNERVEGGPKEIRADGQTVVIDKLLPFKSCIRQEG
jgi:hypothetical protein